MPGAAEIVAGMVVGFLDHRQDLRQFVEALGIGMNVQLLRSGGQSRHAAAA